MREVRNIAERALLLCEGHEILPEHLPIESMAANALSFASAPPPEPMALPPAAPPVEMARPTAPLGAVEDERERTCAFWPNAPAVRRARRRCSEWRAAR